jgi:hypothetical protein
MTNEINNNLPVEPLKPNQKKPYCAPAFEFEQIFEVSALSCGKLAGTQGPCHQNRKSS